MTHEHLTVSGGGLDVWPGLTIGLSVLAVLLSLAAAARSSGPLRLAHLVMAGVMVPMAAGFMVAPDLLAAAVLGAAALVAVRCARGGEPASSPCVVDLVGMAVVLLASTQGAALTVVVAGAWVGVSVITHALTVRVSGAVVAAVMAASMAVMTLGAVAG